MIAGREQIDLGIQEILGDLGRNAESCGRVLDVGNAEINAILLNQTVKLFLHQSSARFAEYVTDERVLASVPAFRRRYKKKSPRAAVWRIYLNLVYKGVFYTLHQAIKFPKEKLAHSSAIRTPIK